MTIFTTKAPGIMKRLIKDLQISDEDAAAIVGNAGHESLGFTVMQEIKPVSGRGGWGWFQWTGPRRKAFEAFAKQKGLALNSDEANYQFLVYELNTTESAALPAVRKANGLDAKTVAFENSFERAGVKAYNSRVSYAKQAMIAYKASLGTAETATVGSVAAGAVVAATQAPSHLIPHIIIGALVIGIAGLMLVRWYKNRKATENVVQ